VTGWSDVRREQEELQRVQARRRRGAKRQRKEGESVKDQLEGLVAQMYSSGILYSEAVREFKKRFIMNVLQQNRGNQCKAARELGMHRNTLSRTIAELKLDVRQLRDGGRRPVRSEKPLPLEKQKLVR
jgi:Fis family transcriptional regulator, factor for inversion stimulation protein